MDKFIFEDDVFRQALNAHAIVSATDVQGDIIYANDLFCEISGYTRAELMGQNHRLVKSDVHSPDKFRHMWRTIAHGEIWHGEIKNIKKDGGFYWVRTTIMPILNPAGKPCQYISIRTDITETKQAEAKLFRSREKLKIALRAKSDFLSRMNHELRTPLHGIIGLSEVMAETDLDDDQREFLSEIQASSDGLMKMLTDLLDFEESMTGPAGLENAMVNLGDLSTMIKQKWQPISLAQNIEYECKISKDLPPALKFDPKMMRRIIDELLNNAFKFTTHGKITLCIRAGAGDTIITEVQDTGVGIPDDAICSIFAPFTQQDSSISRKNDGTGIGLALCKELVTRMGGELSVTSKLGQGSLFRVELPILVAPV
ncbi:MAG: PAS domain S-box protein [Proteobacteria bacterium]|nr:PAS domain S-box protein [Pseudomonadota bacterium]